MRLNRDQLQRGAESRHPNASRYIARVAENELARRVKVDDLRENLANNLRSPSNPGNAERIERYRRALGQLGATER